MSLIESISFKLQKLKEARNHHLNDGLIQSMEQYRVTVAELRMIEYFEELLMSATKEEDDDDFELT